MDVYLFSVFFFFSFSALSQLKKKGKRLIESVSCFFPLFLLSSFLGGPENVLC